MTDELTITGVECFAHHGVFDFERREGQTFVIDLTLGLDTAPAAASDDLQDTVDYGSLVARVKAAVDWIRRHYTLKENIGMGKAGLYYYYHTFAKAMDALGEDPFVDARGAKHAWRQELFDTLKAQQLDNGSWRNQGERTFAEWQEQLRDLAPPVRENAVDALGYFGARALPTLGETLKTDVSSDVRIAAASSIGNIGAVAVAETPALIEASQNAEGRMRGAAVAALGKVGGAGRESWRLWPVQRRTPTPSSGSPRSRRSVKSVRSRRRRSPRSWTRRAHPTLARV